MDGDITLFPEKARIGIAIFAYNEEATIPSVILLCRNYSDKIIVFDDGSNDNTRYLAQTMNAEVQSFQKNQGKGIGVKQAFQWASKNNLDVLVTIDGDGQHDPGVIPFIAEPVIKGKADIAIGSKGFTYQGKSRKGLSWRIGNWMTKKTNISSKTSVYDKRSGFRAYHKKTFRSFDFVSNGFEQEKHMLEQAHSKNFSILEIPMKAIYGHMKKEDLGWGNWVLTKISNILKNLHIDSPLRLSMIAGTFLILSATGASIFAKINYPHYDFLPPGGIFVVMALIALAGFVVLNGIIFEAISHVGTNMVSYLQKNDQIKLEYDPLKGFQK